VVGNPEPWQQAAWLEEALASGRSIESIAREFGRDRTTVAYWIRKHGLVSPHATRHVSKGGVDAAVLAELIERGLSVREIAEQLCLSESTIRHHLRRRGLSTKRASRAKLQREAGICHQHGKVPFVLRSDGYRRCAKCSSEAVSRRRRKVKETLVEEAGGACELCGYHRYIGALQFHHRDRRQKRFELSRSGVTMSIDVARAEAAKCVLLCANCHSEVEAGVASIPGAVPGSVLESPDPE